MSNPALTLPSYSSTTANDRFGLALVMAAALHGIVILGVGFQAFNQKPQSPPPLDVILVQNHTPQTPEKADYLAQISQEGGGQSKQRDRPQTPFSTPEKITGNSIAPMPLIAASPPQQAQSQPRLLTQLKAEQPVQQSQIPPQTETPQNQSSDKIAGQGLDTARLSAEISQELEKYAKRPKKKFITARTKETLSATYMLEWVRRIERIGNLNYPDAARRRQLSGSLVLVVGINKNGSINELIVRNSSGHQILDDAARNIVKLSAPFAPLTGKLAKQADVLYITRTWEFSSHQQLSTH